MDLWDLLIVYTFGGFYSAILGMATIFLIILMMGGVSIYTALWFCGIFLFVMCLGNGTLLVVVLVSIIIIFQLVRGIQAYMEASYTGGYR